MSSPQVPPPPSSPAPDAEPMPSPGGAAPAGRFPRVGGGGRLPSAASAGRRLVYRVLDLVNRMVPKKPGTMVLHSSVDVEDGVLAVLAECAARGCRATVLLEDPERAPLLTALAAGPVRTLPRHSLRGRLAFLRARYVVTTGRLYGSRMPPPSQTVVSLWHGEPPGKVTGRFEGRGGLLCSYAPVCSTVGRAYRSAEFNLSPLQVPIIGAPRNDRMLQADAGSVRRALLGGDADRTVFVWLPTYRVGHYDGELRVDVAGHSGVPYSPEEIRRIDDGLFELGARAVVKVHHRDVNTFTDDYRALRVLTQGDLERTGLTLYPALAAFDGLITDISSVWVDYLLLDKPMVFAFPDVDAYRHGRGLNIEPYEQWVPGPFTRDVDGLLSALGDIVEGRDPMADERARARVRFHQFLDDRSTVRLLDGLGVGSAEHG
jgi:CDP-glycerol glycerophosphotransferase